MRFFGAFNWGFDKRRRRDFLACQPHRAPRRASCSRSMLVVIGFGLNAFRQTPVGFIPQVDGGYLIVVVQLPPGASLSRTDAVQQRALDIALQVPGVAHGVNMVGFSGATFTNAPNAGAIFLMLEPFEKRAKRSGPIGAGHPGRAVAAAVADPGRLAVRRCCRRRCSGIGTAGGFRMMVEDRAGRGSAALQRGHCRSHGARQPDARRRAACSRCSRPRRRRSISTSTAPRRSFSASTCRTCSTPCRSISARPTSTTSICSAAPSASPRRRVTRTGATSQDVLKIRVRNSSGDTVPLGSFTTVRDISGPVPRAALQSLSRGRARRRRLRPDFRKARRSSIMEKLAAETLPDGFAAEWTTLAFQQIRAGNTAMFAFILGGGVRVPGARRAVRKPDVAARGHHDRADVSGRRDNRRHPARAGQQHPHPGRLRGADRACRQERDPDRGIRAPARGSGAAAAGMRRSRRRGCGCGRS